MEEHPQSRRRFIGSLILLAGSAGLLWRYLTPAGTTVRRVSVRLKKGDLPPGGALVYPAERIALINDAGQIHALSLVCTHLGCTVSVSADGLSCPCHGSRFSRDGRVLQGPADRPLARLDVREKDGMLEVLAG